MSEYYAVIRSNNHLAHYGVKGMKWGVRKAIALGDSKKLDKEFNKAAKKLAKLQDKALNSKKYAAKATAYGAAAAGTGTLAIGGTGLVSSVVKKAGTGIGSAMTAIGDAAWKSGNKNVHNIGRSIATIGRGIKNSGAMNAAQKIADWGNAKPKPVYKTMKKLVRDKTTGKPTVVNVAKQVGGPVGQANAISNNTKFRIGSGVAALGLGAASARNAYIAANSKKYLSKANNFKQAMDDTFAGTKYENKYVAIPKTRKVTLSKKRRKK